MLLVIAALAPREAPRKPAAAAARSSPVIARAPRAVAAPWSEDEARAIRSAVASALSPALDTAQTYSCVVLAQDGSTLFEDRAGAAVTPASTQKLIVADAALTLLGAPFRFNTLLGSEQPPQAGIIAGDLWLAGSGDPSFRSSALLRGVRALQAAGVQHIDGRVVVDPSAITGDEINPAWNASDANEDFMAAVSGMSLDEDTVEFHVTGTSAGAPAAVYVNPPSTAVRYAGNAVTGDGDDVTIAGTQTPNTFRLDGVIPPGIKETFYLPVHGIPQYAGTVLTDYLRVNGVSVAAPPATGTAPLTLQVLWNHRSDPLSTIVRHMLVFSDNHYAEQLLRTVGGVDGASPNDADGIAAEISVLRSQHIPIPSLHVVDGSGLGETNRVAAATLAGVLAHFDADPLGNPLYLLLPRGGKDGTLRMYDFTSAAGRVRAKSGHLASTSALAGYVQTRSHGRVVFAFLIDGNARDPDTAIVSAVDRIAAQ
ncbi:MAG: D-alanyl-D-alanine carboxypeptidase/D-alanyl-D-alanine-endopeptidase [Candidatus Eremiobacteraeota bacterium]|nr:D-alanyl-D-alanine carboxypeptidase/D-alanyl-D-alanine-endopeptidase [Candidatus Eremiobacteraeota bacterium]